ncbi:hypothetical protein COV24_01645 [candidate division WWE3 bacterium CG10_big_fil_rev_8_21_14_0_10_32_10]|uniref:Sigma-54 factor interaction domain-containing protein n=1 Tax=candidate division WWE3 bacterium CG10_big_fil_rev_8_21_14_0_10_32_10 TaxID=1975090 RepID=A0A2H0RAX2_UNCKA|nr:MAG: hypothetical protein COV24_01645 [candidate division WWE3 bacterium CG10_big_fil_rev_8_21_14_0_10_32_10]
MFLKYLLFLIVQFPIVYLVRIPSNFVNFFKNSLGEIDNRFQFKLNWKMFFVPLYGDSHWALRVVGILYRFSKGISGILLTFFYFSIFFAFSLLFLLSLPLTYIYYFDYFFILLAVYFALYILYYLTQPFYVIDYSKNFYTLFDVYKMSTLQGRFVLKKIIQGQNLEGYYLNIANFLEKEVSDLYRYVEKVGSTNAKTVAGAILSFGKLSRYRHVNGDLVLAGLLSCSPKLPEYFNFNNLPLYSLHSFLITYKKFYGTHRSKIWDADYESLYKFKYNISKLDRVTPTLNKFSINFIPREYYLAISYIPSFKKEELDLINILTEGSKKVLILGNPGTGKTSLVKQLYLSIQSGFVPKELKFNRIVDLDISSVVSLGERGPQTFSEALNEFSNLKSTLLLLDNLHILFSIKGSDYLSILLPFLENQSLKIICTSDYQSYKSLVKVSPGVDGLFRKIEIKELADKELYDFLVIKNWDFHKKLTIPAMSFLSEVSQQILFDKHNPQKVLSIIDQAVTLSDNKNLILKKDISTVIKNMTGILVGDVSASESSGLLELEGKIKSEVIGQDTGVKAVCEALIRSRGSGINTHKPVASFLFAGPTGVGKTELAKSLARNYYNGEENMIRLDMSEYQTSESINRLIGSEDGEKPGILTELVSKNPFSLILLDEVEKASKNIHMLFLQVLDDGRLTDSKGNTVFFKNTIIVATTNAGTESVINNFSKGFGYEVSRKLFMQDIKHYFPPEFLNRFTEIILFNPLKEDILLKVLDLKFKKLKNNFYESHKINLTLGDDLKDLLLKKGYSKEWGARSLERVLEKVVVTSLSKAILKQDIKAGDSITLDKNYVMKYTSLS